MVSVASMAESNRVIPRRACKSAPMRWHRRMAFPSRGSRSRTDSNRMASRVRSGSDASLIEVPNARSVPKSSPGRPQALFISFDTSRSLTPTQYIIRYILCGVRARRHLEFTARCRPGFLQGLTNCPGLFTVTFAYNYAPKAYNELSYLGERIFSRAALLRIVAGAEISLSQPVFS